MEDDIEWLSEQWNDGNFADEVVSRSRGSSPEIDSIMNEIYKEFPATESWGVQVMDSRASNHGPRTGGHLEFYHPDDEGAPNNPNPFFGTPTVEVFDPNLKGDWLKQAIMGDMMHYAPTASPEFNDLREQYRGTLESNPMNRYMNKRRYKYAQDNQGESRDYDKWFEASGLDAHIRGRLTPDENNEWANAHTPEQIDIVERMKEALKTKSSLERFLR